MIKEVIEIKNKVLSILFISICCILMNTIVNAKYIQENEFCIANLDIDRTKPKIELVNVSNTNTGFEKYANKTHTIKIKLKVIEKNIKDIFFDSGHIKIKIDNTYVNPEYIKFNLIEETKEEKFYQIELSKINENGKLKIECIEGTAIDMGELKNDKIEFDTNIIIDNIAPNGSFEECKISDGKVKGIIRSNEKIRDLEGWKFSSDKLQAEKEFTNNISYQIPITDFAGNITDVEVKITQATYIKLIYASHNSEIGWTYGYGNYDIAGKSAVEKNVKYKSEAIAFNVSGNIEPDFVQAKAYIYTYWGEGSYARCTSSGMLYNYGYNPQGSNYKSMNSNDLVTIENKKYFQLGGSGVNFHQYTDINGKNPIPDDVAIQLKYGICGINMKLKDYSQFSIVYQILVDGVGWINACSNGQECMYSKSKPMTAFRIALIPKTEKQYVLDTWNEDVGTYNLKK